MISRLLGPAESGAGNPVVASVVSARTADSPEAADNCREEEKPASKGQHEQIPPWKSRSVAGVFGFALPF